MMDALVDMGSPRRGSLSSLSRQPSGSFSYGSKSASPNNTLHANGHNANNAHKDLDRFTRYFIIKTVQVIVQSRVGVERQCRTECKPNGNDWFNINITDIPEISDITKSALDPEGFSVRSDWRICCEISLRTKDGGRVVLEHWIISNKALTNFSQNSLQSKLVQVHPKNNQAELTSPVSLASNANNSHSGTTNSPGSTRLRTATFSNTMRTRLNSVDDSTNEPNQVPGKSSVNPVDNADFKSSASCYTLSTTNQAAVSNGDTQIQASPSAHSLAANSIQQSNSVTSQAQSNKAYNSSSIYTIYNRMSLLLKTIMTTTHIVPAFSLSTKTTSSDSCVICYRVYSNSSSKQKQRSNQGVTRGSLEDINDNVLESLGKKGSNSSNSSVGSVNIRQLVGPDELDHFCPVFKLGSIRTDVNELDVSLCYRTDVKNSVNWVKDSHENSSLTKALDEDCITAAKQLLAGHEIKCHSAANNYPFNGTHLELGNEKLVESTDCLDQPLRPAFADIDQRSDADNQNLIFIPIQPAFEKLLDKSQFINSLHERQMVVDVQGLKDSPDSPSNQIKPSETRSEPIQVPQSRIQRFKKPDILHHMSCGSTPKSLTDSFVFVDLNPPFASEEQNDINSFFHGPAPAFHCGCESLKDVDELTNQLANIEANAGQIDEFIDNICVSEDEEEE